MRPSNDAEAWLEKGLRYAEQGFHVRAIANYKRSLLLDPLNASAWAHLGIICESLGLLEESWDSYRRAIQIAPRYVSALLANHGHSESAELTDFSESLLVKLPRIVPHLWTGPDDVEVNLAKGCFFCGVTDRDQYWKPCPKRSCTTWYEILGIPESAHQNQIQTAYNELAKEWDPARLQTQDEVLLDAGYSEVQMKWFDAAYAVLGNPVTRQHYDAELHRHNEDR